MATPFRPATVLLRQYATYHRDRRNVLSHLVGVPLIVFGLSVLLTRPAFALGAWSPTPAWLVFAAAVAWYLTRGAMALGAATVAAIALATVAAHRVAADAGTAAWLAWGLGSFAVGWAIQFVGHWFEGRKPAFADDLVGLLVGPMFVVYEALAPLGLFAALAGAVDGDETASSAPPGTPAAPR